MGWAVPLSCTGALREFDISLATVARDETYSRTTGGRAHDSRADTSRNNWSTGQRRCSSRSFPKLPSFFFDDFLLLCASLMVTKRRFGSSRSFNVSFAIALAFLVFLAGACSSLFLYSCGVVVPAIINIPSTIPQSGSA